MRLGIVSDTHGLLRPEALAALRGVDLILHAGDIGPPALLDALAQLAPVLAVRGNHDAATGPAPLPSQRLVDVGMPWRIAMVHDLATLDPASLDADVRLVVSGHSHQPRHEQRDGRHWLNPGSAGPRRFRLPITLARVEATPSEPRIELVELLVPARP